MPYTIRKTNNVWGGAVQGALLNYLPNSLNTKIVNYSNKSNEYMTFEDYLDIYNHDDMFGYVYLTTSSGVKSVIDTPYYFDINNYTYYTPDTIYNSINKGYADVIYDEIRKQYCLVLLSNSGVDAFTENKAAKLVIYLDDSNSLIVEDESAGTTTVNVCFHPTSTYFNFTVIMSNGEVSNTSWDSTKGANYFGVNSLYLYTC